MTGPEDNIFISLKNEDSLIHLSVPVSTNNETEISTKEQPGPISEPSEKPAPSIEFLASKVAETTSELQSKIGLALGYELLEEEAFGSELVHIETQLGADLGVVSLSKNYSESRKSDAVHTKN